MAVLHQALSDGPVDGEGNPQRGRKRGELGPIGVVPDSLTKEQVLKAVSGFVIGVLKLNREQLAALYRQGVAYHLWEDDSQGGAEHEDE